MSTGRSHSFPAHKEGKLVLPTLGSRMLGPSWWRLFSHLDNRDSPLSPGPAPTSRPNLPHRLVVRGKGKGERRVTLPTLNNPEEA